MKNKKKKTTRSSEKNKKNKSRKKTVSRQGDRVTAPRSSSKDIADQLLTSNESILPHIDTSILDQLGEPIAVGYEPAQKLTPQDEELFRAFQSNLLSLVSHELRTPLTGIMNALGALEHGALPGLSSEDLIKMAKENALRLQQALMVLLDLASLDSGGFHIRLSEIDLNRVMKSRLKYHEALLQKRGVEVQLEAHSHAPALFLADIQKMSRAFDLCLQVVFPRVEESSVLRVVVSETEVQFVFQLSPSMEKLWETSWSQSLMEFHSGVSSPGSAFGSAAFGGVLQSEKAFLSRVEDGFGSEFLLIHEILRLHHGEFRAQLHDRTVEMTLKLPEFKEEESLKEVLKSRAFHTTHALGAVTLVTLDFSGRKDLKELRIQIQNQLMRTTDSVYPLPKKEQLALVLDDCSADKAPLVVERIAKKLQVPLVYSVAHCPDDTADPEELIEIAESRLKQPKKAA